MSRGNSEVLLSTVSVGDPVAKSQLPFGPFPIFNGKGDIWHCSCYGGMKLLEHEMKVVE